MLVLGRKEREAFEESREDYCPYINELYDRSALFNGTKWLMIEVTDEDIFADVKELIKLKMRR